MTKDFNSLAHQLHLDLEMLFSRWPELDPGIGFDYPPGSFGWCVAQAGEKLEETKRKAAESLLPAFDNLAESVGELLVQLRRVWLCIILISWRIPENASKWLAIHWPRKLLPHLPQANGER